MSDYSQSRTPPPTNVSVAVTFSPKRARKATYGQPTDIEVWNYPDEEIIGA
jgi:hypothetical protein